MKDKKEEENFDETDDVSTCIRTERVHQHVISS